MALGQAGQALSFLRADAEAQSLLREAYELDSRVGNQYVRSLAKSDDSVARNEAIQALVKRVSESSATDSAILLASLLSSGQFDSELVEKAESALKKLQTDAGQEEDLQLAMADYWISKDRNEEAIEAYRKVIALRPNDVIALNNLATLLSEKSGFEKEALGYIDRALSVAGRQPLILDTKGVILLNAKKFDEAIQIFEIASAASNDPRLAFHLYLALDKAGRGAESLRVLKAINLEQLSKTVLVPSDRIELSKVYQPSNN
jgi:Tfp pilus assembly protein PilF